MKRHRPFNALITFVFFIINFLITFIFNSFAQEKASYSWQIKPEIFYYNYFEKDIMQIESMHYGVWLSFSSYGGLPFTSSRLTNFILKGEMSGLYGSSDYSGHGSQEVRNGTINNVPQYIVELRGLFGYNLLSNNSIFISPYSGIGFRYLNWNGKDRTTSTELAVCVRESNYYYSPIGIEISSDLNEQWTFMSSIEYDYFWHGKQISHASQMPGAYSTDLINRQRNGYGLRCLLELQKKGTKKDLSLGLFTRYWNIDKSDYGQFYRRGILRTEGVEPKNSTVEIGVKFGWEF